MNSFSDFIPILIAVGFGIYQLVKFLGKGTPGQPKNPAPPTDPFGGKKDPDWGDLLEALGQKTKPKSSGPTPVPSPIPRVEPVRPKVQTSIPRPLIPQRMPEIPRFVPPLKTVEAAPTVSSENYEFYQPTIAEATEQKFKNFDSENAEASHAPANPLVSGGTELRADRFRKFLSNRDRIRDAVVLNEILSKPLALR